MITCASLMVPLEDCSDDLACWVFHFDLRYLSVAYVFPAARYAFSIIPYRVFMRYLYMYSTIFSSLLRHLPDQQEFK